MSASQYIYVSGNNIYHYCSATVGGAPLYSGTLTCTGGPSDAGGGLAGSSNLGSDGWTTLPAGYCMTFRVYATVNSAIDQTSGGNSELACT